MLVTTSRYCPKELRELAKAFAAVFSGTYAARGKKTIESLAEFARKKGHSRICVAMPGSFDFISVDELGRWNWLDGSIKVVTSSFRSGKRGLSGCRSIEGPDSKTLFELLDFQENEKKDVSAFAGDNVIRFEDKESFFKLEVRYERKVQNHD